MKHCYCMPMLLNVAVVPLLLLLYPRSLCKEYRVGTATELIQVSSEIVKGDANKNDIILENDIDFSENTTPFLPIGTNESGSFWGLFDGNGHVIRNLHINAQVNYIGLFGAPHGATIKNIVLDSSCTIESSLDTDGNTYIGGVMGYCFGSNDPCVFSNIVNMANITFSGHFQGTLVLSLFSGGIVGFCYGTSNTCEIKNCANYGSLTNAGNSRGARIGGVVGSIGGEKTVSCVQNSLSYGRITSNATNTTLDDIYFGGIAGYVSNVKIENCLSGGPLLIDGPNKQVGGITGLCNAADHIHNSFWTNELNVNASCCRGDIAYATALNNSTLDKLNHYEDATYSKDGWSTWTMLNLNGGSINGLNQTALIVTQKRFPNPVLSGHIFCHWCTDDNLNITYDPNASTNITYLYAKYVPVHIVRFVWYDGTENRSYEITVGFGMNITYPTGIKKNATEVEKWCTENESLCDPQTMPDHNITLYAFWPKSFHHSSSSFSSSSSLQSSSSSSSSSSSAPFSSPSSPSSYSFSSFSSSSSSSSVFRSEYVKISISNKDITKDEFEAIVKRYTGDVFEIRRFDVDKGTGETTVIIKFTDVEQAQNFVDNISGASNNDVYLWVISFLSEVLTSAAHRATILLAWTFMALLSSQ